MGLGQVRRDAQLGNFFDDQRWRNDAHTGWIRTASPTWTTGQRNVGTARRRIPPWFILVRIGRPKQLNDRHTGQGGGV